MKRLTKLGNTYFSMNIFDEALTFIMTNYLYFVLHIHVNK